MGKGKNKGGSGDEPKKKGVRGEDMRGKRMDVDKLRRLRSNGKGHASFPGRFSSEIAFGQIDLGCRIQRRVERAQNQGKMA